MEWAGKLKAISERRREREREGRKGQRQKGGRCYCKRRTKRVENGISPAFFKSKELKMVVKKQPFFFFFLKKMKS